MDEYTYQTSMEATDKTYIYHISRTDDRGNTDSRSYTIGQMVDMFPHRIHNNVDALVVLNEEASNLF